MSAKSDELRSLEECISSLVDFLCGGVVELHWFAGKLVESNLITRQASDAALKRQGASERDIAERLLRAVVTQVEADEDQFLEFIKLLKSEDALKAVHKKLTKSYERLKQRQGSVSSSFVTGDEIPQLEEDFALREVKEKLKVLITFSDKEGKTLIKRAIAEYINNSLKLGKSEEEISTTLKTLHSNEMLINKEEYETALKIVAEEAAKLTSLTSPPSDSIALDDDQVKNGKEPFFNKNVVYHATICSHAVSTCDAGNYQKFFSKDPVNGRHYLTNVSFSHFKAQRYLAAQEKDNTLYFAFCGEPSLKVWGEKYPSFNEGLQLQVKEFPLRYVADYIYRQGRVVLTGHSFGGLLAMSVAAGVWSLPYRPSELLQQNLICIAFDPPLITDHVVEHVVSESPVFKETLHSFFWKDNPVPRLLKYVDDDYNKSQQVFPLKSDVLKAHFQDESTSQCMKLLHNALEDGRDVTKLKSLLQDKLANPKPYDYLKFHVISSEASGLPYSLLTSDQVKCFNTIVPVSELESLLSKKEENNVKVISQKVLCRYLERSPLYSMPPLYATAYEMLEISHPSVKQLNVDIYDNEVAVTVEGQNLWFCQQVTVGNYTVETPADKVTGNSIQFNCNINQKKALAIQNDKVRVTIQNQFCKPIKIRECPVEIKEYRISLRQQQLAKLAPMKLIELAYLCALLEQNPHGNALAADSEKLVAIKEFLENVVKVVPLESIVFAMNYGNDNTVKACSQALSNSPYELPVSFTMCDGIQYLLDKFKYGSSYDTFCNLFTKLSLKIRPFFPKDTEITELFDFHDEVAGDYFEMRAIPRKRNIKIPPSMLLERAKVGNFTPPQMDIIEVPPTLLKVLDAYKPNATKNLIISGFNIDQLYPISSEFELKSPLNTLREGKKKLTVLRRELNVYSSPASNAKCKQKQKYHYNTQMLKAVNEIRQNELATCVTLLGAFMEQKEVTIPLFKSRRDRQEALTLESKGCLGVWALFNLSYDEIQPLFAKLEGNQLLVKIESYIKGIFKQKYFENDSEYAAKLQFIVQGFAKTVTCHSCYISYSLERQLKALSEELHIDSIPLKELLHKWSILFENNILSLVALSHRPLVARWMKWALMVHTLREKLAEYTAVGVVGLVNSGKSRLVSSLFGIEIPTGTTELKRTTVPFMFNLEDTVDGLDVIDFPGVDDLDESIPDLADLLLNLAQIAVFVVDYRKIHTQSARKWLERLRQEKIPVLVCLTYADKLYAEHMGEDGSHPRKDFMIMTLKQQLSTIKEKLGPEGSHSSEYSTQMDFFSFCQDHDSVLNTRKGRALLRSIGIRSIQDVGDWLVGVFRKWFDQQDLAERLHKFIHKHDE